LTERVSIGHAKAHLSELVAAVVQGGRRVILERRGRPLAALVSLDELDDLERAGQPLAAPQGALALVGAWAALDDAEIDALVEEVYAQRERDLPRPIPSFDA
jgi:prevent-host-death family protein